MIIGKILRAVVFYSILTILVIVFFPVSVIVAVFAAAARGASSHGNDTE